MVDVKKVTASFDCSILQEYNDIPNPQTSLSHFYTYVIANPQYTTYKDPFSIIANRPISTSLGTKNLTGFLIPFSRRYLISVTVQPQQAYASANIVLGSEYRTFLCNTIRCEVGFASYTTPTTETYYTNSAAIIPGSVIACRDGTITPGFPLGRALNATSYTIEVDLYAGDFIFFRIFYFTNYPPNGNLYLSGSPGVYAKITEISDI